MPRISGSETNQIELIFSRENTLSSSSAPETLQYTRNLRNTARWRMNQSGFLPQQSSNVGEVHTRTFTFKTPVGKRSHYLFPLACSVRWLLRVEFDVHPATASSAQIQLTNTQYLFWLSWFPSSHCTSLGQREALKACGII
jgi:hypothetical protein